MVGWMGLAFWGYFHYRCFTIRAVGLVGFGVGGFRGLGSRDNTMGGSFDDQWGKKVETASLYEFYLRYLLVIGTTRCLLYHSNDKQVPSSSKNESFLFVCFFLFSIETHYYLTPI